VKCDALLSGDVKADSYYYGCDWIEDVKLQMYQVSIYLDFGSGFNKEILTPEAIEFYKDQYGVDDIEDLYKELVDNVELDDISREFIIDIITHEYYDGVSETIGGGYNHSIFDGDFELTSFRSRRDAGSIDSASMTIVNKYVVDFIDEAVTGQNIEFTVFEDTDVVDVYDDVETAIKAAKDLANQYIAKGEPLPEITVEKSTFYMVNGSGEIESNDDYEVEYDITSDVDYQEYV
jgi:hypothetical protein